MTERGIIFSGPLIGPLLRDEKTVTRRLVTPQPAHPCSHVEPFTGEGGGWIAGDNTGRVFHCPYGEPGDSLWVRETWGIRDCGNRVSLAPETWPNGWPVERLFYAADESAPMFSRRTSFFMPRWASRITLEVTGVRVERLQEITEEDARREGVASRAAFFAKWDELHGARAWAANPWVWVVEFRRLPARFPRCLSAAELYREAAITNGGGKR